MRSFEGRSPHPNPLPQGEREQIAPVETASPLPSAGEGQGEGGLSLRHFGVLFAAAITAIIAMGIEARADGVDLTVDVSGLRNYKGRLVLALWPDTEDSTKFPDASKVQFRDERPGDPPCDFPKTAVCRRMIESLQNLTASYTFKDLPPGDYAVFVFHDENNNAILDTGFMKRPLEARGYSQVLPDDVNPVHARIRFQQARFSLNEPKTITVGLRYPPRL
jgi:uncharacterized protein (DUF2141 family)